MIPYKSHELHGKKRSDEAASQNVCARVGNFERDRVLIEVVHFP